MNANTPAIELRDLSFSYGGGWSGTAPVLDHCSFELPLGQAAILSGENGAGKSTLLKLALGELTPQHGKSLLFDTPSQTFRDWKRVGYVPQRAGGSYDRFPATVLEVVAANRYALGHAARRGSRAAGLQALELVGLANHAGSLVGELSGGQQQRALLARALVNDPELLVLDEPTSGLDRASVDEFIGVMSTLMRDSKRAVLMVSHDLERLEDLDADRIVLSQGVIHRV